MKLPAFVMSMAFCALWAQAAGAQTTRWGDPDLQGFWSNQTPVPLERPAALAAKASYTPEEAAEFERTALERLLRQVAPEVPFSGELNEIWLETANGKVSPTRATSLVVDPPDGKIPYTPEGQRRWDATPKLGPFTAANQAEDRAQSERCLSTDGLLVPNPFYNNLHHIIQAPGYVVILTEMMHEMRIIPLNRNPHVGSKIGTWLGDSRGYWEGRTLVVDTTNFNDRRLFRGSTSQLRLVERFTRLDDGTIQYRVTVTDPATFAAPWTLENGLHRVKGPIYEVACHEGNYSLAGILSGARAEDKAAR